VHVVVRRSRGLQWWVLLERHVRDGVSHHADMPARHLSLIASLNVLCSFCL
jgi:hypothetical protein